MKNVKLNEFLGELSNANNNGQVSYLLYDVYGSITRYDVLSNVAELIKGQYKAFDTKKKDGSDTKTYKVIDENGEEIKTNRLKLLVKNNLKFRLSMISGNSTILLNDLLHAYASHLSDMTIDAIYNNVNYTKISAYLSDKKVNLTVTTNWYPQAKFDNKVVFHITVTNGTDTNKKDAIASVSANDINELTTSVANTKENK